MANNTMNILLGSPSLRDRLPRGGIQRIAEKYGVSWQWAYYVISGKHAGNPGIIRDAERLAQIEEESRKQISEVL
jgi:hypothetical protein